MTINKMLPDLILVGLLLFSVDGFGQTKKPRAVQVPVVWHIFPIKHADGVVETRYIADHVKKESLCEVSVRPSLPLRFAVIHAPAGNPGMRQSGSIEHLFEKVGANDVEVRTIVRASPIKMYHNEWINLPENSLEFYFNQCREALTQLPEEVRNLFGGIFGIGKYFTTPPKPKKRGREHDTPRKNDGARAGAIISLKAPLMGLFIFL